MYLCPQPKILELKKGMFNFPVGEMPEMKKKKTPELSEKESYRIYIDENGVLIEGADDRGLYYGELTLKQLMLNYRGCLPYLYLYDEPEFSYRGFMIDSCRHFFTVDEIKKFVEYVGGRVKTMLLLETAEARENLKEMLDVGGIDMVHIGLNDLHLSYGMKFMFQLLTDGTVEDIIKTISNYGIPYGFGGIAQQYLFYYAITEEKKQYALSKV